MHSSLYLLLPASQGGAAASVPTTSPCSPCTTCLAARSSQLWRSHARLTPLSRRSRHRASRLVFVCETAVEVDGSTTTEATEPAPPPVGSRIRVSKPLSVFHVPKHPNFELEGREGELKDVLKSWKGKPLSANLPYKVQFILDLDGKQVKFFAHLKRDEFQVI